MHNPYQPYSYPGSPPWGTSKHAGVKVALYVLLGIASAVFLATIALSIQTFKVPAPSMEPTIRSGDRIITMRLPGDTVAVNDIVAYKDGKKVYVKRVVACGGDQVVITGGRLMVNGQEGVLQGDGMGDMNQTWTLEEDEYFLLGDNLANSQDSRHTGPVKQRDIIGELVFVWHTG